jgi:mannose-1-phosphate guanylyltransferase
MQTVILGAGMGTRLRPITETIPKILLPICDRPLLEYTLGYLQKQGITRVAMNTHHLADQVQAWADGSALCRVMRLAISRETEILGTGGGLKGLERFLTDEDFIVYNGDVITDTDLAPAVEFHRENKAVATLILHDCPQFNKIKLDPNQTITAIIDGPDQATGHAKKWAFTGIAVMNRRIFKYLAPHGFQDIKDVYRTLIARRDGSLTGFTVSGHYWRDIGNAVSYWELHRDILAGHKRVWRGMPVASGPVYRSPTAKIASQVSLRGFGSIGAGAVLEAGEYEDCVVLPGTVRNVPGLIRNSIIGNNFVCKVDAAFSPSLSRGRG